ncbi:hypothetical protein [Geomicrobium sp. JCM 19039]|uniref:hypothetical protein n=1 Tax=Geomicrobium sp. JCM 19039 TaxID=1460636 RepID=UPI00045F3933|nr:hypothetical protein [Geomicrobium sp. JCM 19039]GAK11113.1 hypothetical protein JCM19039_788 [Geomicrobium sp. JCM 19039]
MLRFSKVEMIRLLSDLCGIPRPFLVDMDDDALKRLFHERLSVHQPYALVPSHKKSS